QPADIVVLTSYTLNNARLLLNSDIGRPYDPETQTGVIGKNYCYHITPSVTGFFKDKFNAAMGAGSLGSTLDDYNNDNFDQSDVEFIHGGSITMKQLGKRPISENVAPSGTSNWGKECKQKSTEYFHRSIPVTAQGACRPQLNNYVRLDPQ